MENDYNYEVNRYDLGFAFAGIGVILLFIYVNGIILS